MVYRNTVALRNAHLIHSMHKKTTTNYLKGTLILYLCMQALMSLNKGCV